MRAWVFRVHGRDSDRLPSCLSICGQVAIDVTVANCGDRTPEIVMVLGIQHSHNRIIETNRDERHETCAVENAHLFRDDQLADQWMICDRRPGKPEASDLSLLSIALCAPLSP